MSQIATCTILFYMKICNIKAVIQKSKKVHVINHLCKKKIFTFCIANMLHFVT